MEAALGWVVALHGQVLPKHCSLLVVDDSDDIIIITLICGGGVYACDMVHLWKSQDNFDVCLAFYLV